MNDFVQDVLKIICAPAEIDGQRTQGQSESYTIQSLRDLGWRRVSVNSLEEAGFKIVDGYTLNLFTGRRSRARVVTL